MGLPFHTAHRVFGEGNGNPLQYSRLENSMDGGAWQAAVHGVVKSRKQLSDFPFTFPFMHWRRKWQPTPVFQPGESQGWGSLVGCCLWGCTELDTTEAIQQQQQHGVFSARILEWFAIPSSSGPCFVRTLLCDPFILGGPLWHGSQLH